MNECGEGEVLKKKKKMGKGIIGAVDKDSGRKGS